MPYWLSSSKVRLGLLINGLYLLSLFLPSHSQVGGRPYIHTYEHPTFETSGRSAESPTRRPPVVVELPPPTRPMQATSHHDSRSGSVMYYLDKDLTLLEKEGNQLLLSPTFTVRADGAPEPVLLQFISYSEEHSLSTNNTFSIIADGREVWPAYGADGGESWKGGQRELVPPFVTEAEGGVIENVSKTIPYEVFAKSIGAKTVVFTIGPHVLKLKAEQLEALRDMHRLWSGSRSAESYPPKQF